jgi:hypothetical protein
MALARPRQIQLGSTLWHQATQDFLEDLEQAHVRGMNRRGLRLELIAGLVIALLMPALSVVAAHAQAATATALTAGNLSGSTQTLSATVTTSATPSQPVTSGTVTIKEVAFNGTAWNQPIVLTSGALNAQGSANLTVTLAAGNHQLIASFTPAATSAYATSDSASVDVNINFEVAVSNLSPATTPVNTLTPGQSGTATVTVTVSQEFVDSLTAPQFVKISCSGLPDDASCTFTPETVEILPNTDTALTSSMVIQTEAASTTFAAPATRPGKGSSPIAWAFLFPGAIGLGGLAWGARRRRWLNRLSLVALVGLVTLLGTTACNPRYSYLNHGPNPNPATPAGTYNVTVSAQSSDGVTATTHYTSFVLTVK